MILGQPTQLACPMHQASVLAPRTAGSPWVSQGVSATPPAGGPVVQGRVMSVTNGMQQQVPEQMTPRMSEMTFSNSQSSLCSVPTGRQSSASGSCLQGTASFGIAEAASLQSLQSLQSIGSAEMASFQSMVCPSTGINKGPGLRRKGHSASTSTAASCQQSKQSLGIVSKPSLRTGETPSLQSFGSRKTSLSQGISSASPGSSTDRIGNLSSAERIANVSPGSSALSIAHSHNIRSPVAKLSQLPQTPVSQSSTVLSTNSDRFGPSPRACLEGGMGMIASARSSRDASPSPVHSGSPRGSVRSQSPVRTCPAYGERDADSEELSFLAHPVGKFSEVPQWTFSDNLTPKRVGTAQSRSSCQDPTRFNRASSTPPFGQSDSNLRESAISAISNYAQRRFALMHGGGHALEAQENLSRPSTPRSLTPRPRTLHSREPYAPERPPWMPGGKAFDTFAERARHQRPRPASADVLMLEVSEEDLHEDNFSEIQAPTRDSVGDKTRCCLELYEDAMDRQHRKTMRRLDLESRDSRLLSELRSRSQQTMKNRRRLYPSVGKTREEREREFLLRRRAKLEILAKQQEDRLLEEELRECTFHPQISSPEYGDRLQRLPTPNRSPSRDSRDGRITPRLTRGRGRSSAGQTSQQSLRTQTWESIHDEETQRVIDFISHEEGLRYIQSRVEEGVDLEEAQQQIVNELVQDAMGMIQRRVSAGACSGDSVPIHERLGAPRLGELAIAENLTTPKPLRDNI